MNRDNIIEKIERAARERTTELEFHYGLNKLPSEIGQLTDLQRLDLRANQLSELPADSRHSRKQRRQNAVMENVAVRSPGSATRRLTPPGLIREHLLQNLGRARVAQVVAEQTRPPAGHELAGVLTDVEESSAQHQGRPGFVGRE